MKTGSLLIVAFFAPALFCPAQDKMPPATGHGPANRTGCGRRRRRPTAMSSARPMILPSPYGKSRAVDEAGKDITVRPDGMISMPLLGDVKAAGKTPLQLADEITVKLKKYIQDPNVTVILVAMNSKKVYLIGEVGKTGPIEMTPGMTLLQAIAYRRRTHAVRQREEDLHSAQRRRKAAEDSRAIQASIEGRRLAQSHSESGRYDCRSVRQPT